MPFNLINDPWIPVRRKDGTKEIIRPADIVRGMDNPIVAFDAPRADFNGALIQFMIGLSQTCLAPVFARSDEDDWYKIFNIAPSVEQLQHGFDKVAHCFNFDGEYPRFMQDESASTKIASTVFSLFIEAPGENTIKENKDHFVKRENVKGMSKEMAALALLTLQINAPSGGQGHRTSLRGGGPLTTIVIGDTLWETIWLNTLPHQVFNSKYLRNSICISEADKFPWMGQTKISTRNENGIEVQTTPNDVNPLVMYWGTPRRIHFLTENYQEGICSISQKETSCLITNYSTVNYGNNYKDKWKHPLSPYNGEEGTEQTSEHGQPGGVRYKHWLGFIQKKQKTDKKGITIIEKSPAHIVSYFLGERSHTIEDARKRSRHVKYDNNKIPFRVLAFGYDMDNMTARCWYEGIIPVIIIKKEVLEKFETRVEQCVKVAMDVSDYVRSVCRQVLRKRSGDVAVDSSLITALESNFWSMSERDFYETIKKMKQVLEKDELQQSEENQVKEEWLSQLKNCARDVFGIVAKTFPIENSDIKRISVAENQLEKLINGNALRNTLNLELKEKPVSDSSKNKKSTV